MIHDGAKARRSRRLFYAVFHSRLSRQLSTSQPEGSLASILYHNISAIRREYAPSMCGLFCSPFSSFIHPSILQVIAKYYCYLKLPSITLNLSPNQPTNQFKLHCIPFQRSVIYIPFIHTHINIQSVSLAFIRPFML